MVRPILFYLTRIAEYIGAADSDKFTIDKSIEKKRKKVRILDRESRKFSRERKKGGCFFFFFFFLNILSESFEICTRGRSRKNRQREKMRETEGK